MSTIRDRDSAIGGWLRSQAPAHASDALWPAALERIRTTRQRRLLGLVASFSSLPVMSQAAIAGGVVTAILLVTFGLLSGRGDVGTPEDSTIPTPTADATPADSGRVNLRWPGTRAEPAGRYAWHMTQRQWMHHVYNDTIGVSLEFAPVDDIPAEGTPVTIAGFPGIHRQGPAPGDAQTPSEVSPSHTEVWWVPMDDVIVRIVLQAVPGTPESLIDEARAVVESIERVPMQFSDAHRLIFTLPEGWDSG